jgi:hypothetical protein
MSKPKMAVLAALGVLSLLGPIAEIAFTGRLEDWGPWTMGETLASAVLIFWWYHLDKAERDYRAGILMNGGMLALAALALPIYFVRTRGWKRGGIAIAGAVAVFVALLVLEELGGWLGEFFRP